jgi:hypothetical protein
VIINASCNVFIYMLFSEKYRMLLKSYLYQQWAPWSKRGENELLLTITGPVSVWNLSVQIIVFVLIFVSDLLNQAQF